MLSRRNIRIKVMQQHYAHRQGVGEAYEQLARSYRRSVEQSYDLYLFVLWQFVKITEFAQRDAERRQAKYLPSEEDKRFSPKLFHNPLIQSVRDNGELRKMLENRHIPNRMDKDMGQLFYNEFAKTNTYTEYLNTPEGEEEHQRTLLALFKFCLNNETFTDYVEERYDNWIHDKSLVVGAMKKSIKVWPDKPDFYKDFVPADEATLEFGEDLLYKSIFFDNDILELIQPALKNWKVDRVAIIDLILLKLAVCEMLHFPTIPVKVSINEFVDISKIYSTPKSKDFINGILDRLMKQLSHSGDIRKEGRGLVD